MIEPLTSLAFSVYSNKGVYALLLGSGISRSAGIPTGWDIVLDLIRKVAHLQGANCEPDPAAWYQTATGNEPDYAALIAQLGQTPAERNQLLRHYFEPTEEDREQNRKTPTPAHHAIAQMVVSGYVRVIVTTNFDRLMEQALEAIGVIPTVISTPDAVEGAMPLVHTPCTIIKIHGDYLDTRIRNTPSELSAYDDRSNSLLDRVFDEYGLIVCGWSAEWDRALLSAMERCPSRRFTTYWTVRGPLGEAARHMVAHRMAVVIPIEGADSFFTSVSEKVASLDELAQPHPLSPAIAAATLKRYLGTGQKIRLHSLVIGEADTLRSRLAEPRFSMNEPFTAETVRQRLERYEVDAQIMIQIMINGCYWGDEDQHNLWVSCLERTHTRNFNGIEAWLKLSHYPALLLFYAGGIAAVAAGKYDTLASLFTRGQVEGLNRMESVTARLYPLEVMDERVTRLIPGYDRNYVPGSDYLDEILSGPLANLFPSRKHYTMAFDRFEYLLGLYHASRNQREDRSMWGPAGCFLWRNQRSDSQDHIANVMDAELDKTRDNWPPLKANLFMEPIASFLSLKVDFDQFIARWRASKGVF